MDSSSIKRPGFGLPLNEEGPPDRFPNALVDDGATVITVRERTIMALIDSITDKLAWDRKVFDESIVQKWRQEALDNKEMDITEKMLDWTFAELQDKARLYQKDGMVSIFDLETAVIKSDTVVTPQLMEDLKLACQALETVPARLKDWHPGSDGKVLDLVHPSLFPLIYGRSKVLNDGHVGLKNCMEHIGKGKTTEIPDDSQLSGPRTFGQFRDKIPNYWSRRFQWLPCQVDFSDDNDVLITSYINNLHPVDHADLYSALQRCIAKAIPLWDRTLSSTYVPLKPRIDMKMTKYDYPQGRDPPDDFMRPGSDDIGETSVSDYQRRHQWERSTRVLIHPEPGRYNSSERSVEAKINLRKQFKDTGLQVIVKLANIELSPDKPEYEGGSWHIEGQLNERICASALLYYDSENITENFLAFRQSVEDDEITMKAYGQDDYEGCETIYGIEQEEARVQELGRVATKQGRLIAFPNVLHHKVSPFRLQDPSRPGHRKLLALFLVDPHIPILSTANVPPQQKEWWSEKIQRDRSLSMLPVELTDKIIDDVSDMPISLEEAKEIRLELMEERKAFVEDVKTELESYTFSFCEH